MMLGGVCACCALPLWPYWLRQVVIYFLVFILAGRPAIWLVVKLLTLSRYDLMILPMLDEEKPMSFSRRFNPIYTLERKEAEPLDGGEDDEGEGSGDEGEGSGDEGEGSGDEDGAGSGDEGGGSGEDDGSD